MLNLYGSYTFKWEPLLSIIGILEHFEEQWNPLDQSTF